jgi:hypothetical protein
VTGFLPTFLLSCVRAVLLVMNCLLTYSPEFSPALSVAGRCGQALDSDS